MCVSVIITVGGFASGFAPNYKWLIACGGVVGFGIGGANIPFDLLAEFLPSSHRGTFLLSIEYFWTIGSLFVAGVAWAMLAKYGWRYLVFITALPVAINSLLAAVYLPESPKWLLLKGRGDEAEKIVRDAALVNGATMKPFTLVDDEPYERGEGYDNGSYFDLIKTGAMRKVSLPLWTIWGIFGFTYYGLILLVARMYNTDQSDDDAGDGEKTCSFDYSNIFMNASSEMVGVFASSLVIDRMGRVKTQTLFYFMAGVAVFCTGLELPPTGLLIMAMLGRGSIMGASCVTWVTTPEVYTTRNRTTGHAVSVTISKLCAFLSPYVVVSNIAPFQLGLLFGVLNCIAAGFSFLLPETLDPPMEEDKSYLLLQQDNEAGSNRYCDSAADSQPDEGRTHKRVSNEVKSPLTPPISIKSSLLKRSMADPPKKDRVFLNKK